MKSVQSKETVWNTLSKPNGGPGLQLSKLHLQIAFDVCVFLWEHRSTTHLEQGNNWQSKCWNQPNLTEVLHCDQHTPFRIIRDSTQLLPPTLFMDQGRVQYKICHWIQSYSQSIHTILHGEQNKPRKQFQNEKREQATKAQVIILGIRMHISININSVHSSKFV